VIPAAVIFDCDGLLVDTESAWTRAEEVLYARYGSTFTLEHKRELLGQSGPVAWVTIERHLSMPDAGERLEDELRELVTLEIERDAPAMPGTTELVAALRAAGTPIGLASNSPRDLVDLSLRGAGFSDAFAAIVTADDVEHGKPSPDVYLEAARRLGADPSATVALEDSPTGVLAGRAAGMFVIGVPGVEGIDLSQADLVVASLRDPAVFAAVGVRLAA
jgi:HAD superfamily hydrolase (TIGR01509 family)